MHLLHTRRQKPDEFLREDLTLFNYTKELLIPEVEELGEMDILRAHGLRSGWSTPRAWIPRISGE